MKAIIFMISWFLFVSVCYQHTYFSCSLSHPRYMQQKGQIRKLLLTASCITRRADTRQALNEVNSCREELEQTSNGIVTARMGYQPPADSFLLSQLASAPSAGAVQLSPAFSASVCWPFAKSPDCSVSSSTSGFLHRTFVWPIS